MSKIETYLSAKRDLNYAESWMSLIGSPYSGGGGGVGEIASAVGYYTIYHQPYDGATNYHEISAEFRVHLNQVLMNRWPELLRDSMNLFELEVKKKADDARAEAEAVLNATK